jgi:hypothetical protein
MNCGAGNRVEPIAGRVEGSNCPGAEARQRGGHRGDPPSRRATRAGGVICVTVAIYGYRYKPRSGMLGAGRFTLGHEVNGARRRRRHLVAATEKPDLGEHRPFAVPTIPPRPVGPGVATQPRHVLSGGEAHGLCVANRASRRASSVLCVTAPCRTDGPHRDVSGRVILSGAGDERDWRSRPEPTVLVGTTDRGTHCRSSRGDLVYSLIGPWQLTTGFGGAASNSSPRSERADRGFFSPEGAGP